VVNAQLTEEERRLLERRVVAAQRELDRVVQEKEGSSQAATC
jgi:hypothetical protein